MEKRKTYYNWNYDSKNPLRRFAHRIRFEKSIEAINADTKINVLDYGCGDGLFLNQLKSVYKENIQHSVGFEPYMDAIKDNLVNIFKDWKEIERISNEIGGFDYITSFEVFEHFHESKQKEALSSMATLLKDTGKIILSVPIEKGMPSLVKNVIRRINHPHNKHIYNLKYMTKSVFGQPIPEFRSEDKYLPHMGFYFHDLEKLAQKDFEIENKNYSPFKHLGYNFNSQIFYSLKKKLRNN